MGTQPFHVLTKVENVRDLFSGQAGPPWDGVGDGSGIRNVSIYGVLTVHCEFRPDNQKYLLE